MYSNSRKFLVSFLASLFAIICIFCAMFYLAISTDVKKDLWLREVFEVKKLIEKKSRVAPRRIIIISGSNGLFGINSEVIENFTGIRTINLATHVYWPFSVMVDQLQQVSKQNDVIVLPLELALYTRSKTDDYSRWFMKKVLNWYQSYFFNLPLKEKLTFMSKVPLSLLFKTLKNRYISKNRDKLLKKYRPTKDLYSEVEDIWSGKVEIRLEDQDLSNPYYAYSIRSLNQWGDVTLNVMTNEENLKDDNYRRFSLNISDNFTAQYKRLTELADERNLKLIFTWPVALKSDQFNLDREKDRELVLQFKNRLYQAGVNIKGSLKDVHYPREFFFDTSKHLNQKGVTLRSNILKKVILNNL